jgi:raffinose/stachyose/melibiose transport system substrate-binding protein
MVLWYNKTLFEEQGWTPPTTMEELNALAEQITALGKHVFAYSNSQWKPSNEHLLGVYWNNYAGAETVYSAHRRKALDLPGIRRGYNSRRTRRTGWYSGAW